eukprot:GHVH01006492.1.p1 GENE.GHVH01006492.1~~GHVH01006492.1.p1  ORF type:complete len:735 (+),score=104.37 GHVH01006492.1:44-2248(+)
MIPFLFYLSNTDEMSSMLRDESHLLTLSNGKSIHDPYHILEEPENEMTKAYALESQNEFEKWISCNSTRDELVKDLTDVIDYPTTGLPSLHGNYYYIFHNRGLEDQSVLYRRSKDSVEFKNEPFLPEEWEVFCDPNKFSADGTSALRVYDYSQDGSLWAYGVSDKGSDWFSIRVKNAITGEDLEDKVEWVKFSGIEWYKSEGFYYSSYGMKDLAVSAGTETEKQTFHRVFYHRLGTDQTEDVVVFRATESADKDLMHGVTLSHDHEWIFCSVSRGCETKNNVFFKRADDGVRDDVPWNELFTNWDAEYDILYVRDHFVLIMTNLEAENYRLIQVNLQEVDEHGKFQEISVLAEMPNKLDTAVVANDLFILQYIVDATHKLSLWNWNPLAIEGSDRMTHLHDLVFPGVSVYTAGAIKAKFDQSLAFFSITNYTMPPTHFKLDLSKKSCIVQKIRSATLSPSAPNPDNYMTEQIKFTSKDGTVVPMFIVRSCDPVHEPRPLLLYGYGGFGIDLLPGFSVSKLLMLEMGAIYVVVNLRGGGEYGDKWHDGGRREDKQNVFDDFISAAEKLITMGYTTKEQLVIQGGSNGGLLVTACANQRPDLFAGGIAAVPVTDMMRFHKFTIGHAWVPEYGNPDDPDDVDFLLAYSPLHTVPDSGIFPAMMIMTADHDDRVVPLHSYKYHAELCHKLKSVPNQSPFLLRVDLNAGHGAGKPKSKQIQEMADMYTFFLRVTGLEKN